MTLYTCRTVFFFLVICFFYQSHANTIRKEFEDTLQKEPFVAALFTKECCTCTECVEAETLLAVMSDSLLKDSNVLLLKLVEQPSIAKEYGVKDYPSLVFFRNQQPALYNGQFDQESLLDWFNDSKDVALKLLDDNSFEHLTQAATGATTGDWLVAFHDSSCGGLELVNVLDGFALRVKRRGILVAQVDTEKSPELKERFSIEKCPTLIFFRKGKMYHYPYAKPKISELQTFVDGHFRNVKSNPVPVPKSPFDRLVEETVVQLKANPMLFLMGIGGALLFIATLYGISEKKSPKKTE